MSFKITLSEEDIKNNPNDYDLGHLIREKYYKYLDLKFDKCLKCGLESPYTEDTHVDMRYGYVEGMGQFCFQEKICKE